MVNDQRDLVSLMVRLRATSLWERLLIPPFVFFFQMLYPFSVLSTTQTAPSQRRLVVVSWFAESA